MMMKPWITAAAAKLRPAYYVLGSVYYAQQQQNSGFPNRRRQQLPSSIVGIRLIWPIANSIDIHHPFLVLESRQPCWQQREKMFSSVGEKVNWFSKLYRYKICQETNGLQVVAMILCADVDEAKLETLGALQAPLRMRHRICSAENGP